MKRLEKRLTDKGLQGSTRAKYKEIIESVEDEDLLSWIQRKAKSQLPVGSLLPMRAAVKHYLAAEHGYSLEELEDLLPAATGKDAESYQALNMIQLAQYHAAVDKLKNVTVRTILTLLPMTGLKVSEACELPASSVELDHHRLRLLTKNGHTRDIPLSRQAVAAFRHYLSSGDREQDANLFFGFITPHTIRKYTRQISSEVPDLGALSPEVLRATFAVLALKQGMDIVTLQSILGHESIVNTRRFLTQLDLR